jgi:hypothetical protein
MKNLVKDASMGPLREAFQQGVEITKLNKEEMRPVMLKVLVNILSGYAHGTLVACKIKYLCMLVGSSKSFW